MRRVLPLSVQAKECYEAIDPHLSTLPTDLVTMVSQYAVDWLPVELECAIDYFPALPPNDLHSGDRQRLKQLLADVWLRHGGRWDRPKSISAFEHRLVMVQWDNRYTWFVDLELAEVGAWDKRADYTKFPLTDVHGLATHMTHAIGWGALN